LREDALDEAARRLAENYRIDNSHPERRQRQLLPKNEELQAIKPIGGIGEIEVTKGPFRGLRGHIVEYGVH